MKFKAVLALALLALGAPYATAQTQGVSKTEILVGSILDLSGPVAAYGKQTRAGMQLRADEINEQGGVNGRKIKLLVEDNAYDPKRSVLAGVFATLTSMWNRGTQVLLSRFDAELVFRGIEEERANWIPLVPTMAVAVLDHPSRPTRDLSSLQVVVAGGSPVAPELVKRIEHELGVDFVMVFGQTESSAAVCLTTRKDTLEHRTSTIGYPLGGVELRICDQETGRTLQYGETREICICGALTLLSYYNMPEASVKAIDADGWLHSGDLGTLAEDGYPKITGRLKDMIIRGGSNIYPREIEDVLSEHPGIAESAVFGIPDATYGEVVVAAIRSKPGALLDQAGLTSFLGERVARYKLPSHVWFIDQFPLTPSGKVQKFVLREQFSAVHQNTPAAKG